MSGTRLLGSNRDFTLLWAGGAISSVGSTTSLLSYPLLVLGTTGSAGLVGITMAVAMVTRLVAGLPGGVLVDYMDKKQLMLLCDLLRAATQGVIALLILTNGTTFAVILVMIALESAFSTVFSAVEPTAVRLVVPQDQLAVALARNEARGAAAMMAGPPLGGLLYGITPWLPFVFDAASYLLSFLLVALLRTSMSAAAGSSPEGTDPRTTRRPNVFRNMVEGLRFLWQQRFIRTTLLLIAGNNLVSNAIMLVVIVLSQQQGDHELTTGLIMTIAGMGSLAGALLAPTAVRLLSVRAILVLNRVLWTLLLLVMPVVENRYLLGCLIGLMFMLGPTGSSAVTTLAMRLTPEGLQGRGRATAGMLAGIAGPFGTAVVGFALQNTTATVTVLGLAAWMGLMATVALLSRPIRREGAVRVGRSTR